MSPKLNELRENGLISEPEVLDLVSSYYKLSKLGLLKEDGFQEVLSLLGIEQLSDNKFRFDENSIYTINPTI
jgi:hypothetical protein